MIVPVLLRKVLSIGLLEVAVVGNGVKYKQHLSEYSTDQRGEQFKYKYITEVWNYIME